MDPNQERIEAVFETARHVTSRTERAAYLDEACGQDAALRQVVEAMLAAEAAADEYFRTAESPGDAARDAMTEPRAKPASAVAEGPGTVIGRYTLREQIGEGGFGVVYLAEQREPVVRKVALKIIKPGLDTREVVARFEAERQALALMDHPNIAQVFDGGATDTGRPYFVMELVRGIPLTRFCNEQRLNTTQRLELFATVCAAVQHAHQKGIIHRDLKPTNILVTQRGGQPVPKVIDFGVAKATGERLTAKTLHTGFPRFVGTPAYMSPEQASLSGLDVDTRSDIYSLGVLLYELLTGAPPFTVQTLLQAGLEEMLRMIREEEPLKPSTRLGTLAGDELTTVAAERHCELQSLERLLRGELDWIVMKCLEKDRRRRYATANGLAADIHRYLNNELVSAVAPSVAYRVQKFVRRNQVMVTAMALVAAALVLGTAGSTWQAIRASRAEVRAEAALNRSLNSLWQAHFERAQALRQSGTLGQRAQAVAAIRAAAAIRPSPELRTEAIAALALADLEDAGAWHPMPTNAVREAVDGPCTRLAVATSDGQVEVRSLVDYTLEARMTNLPTEPWGLWFSRDGSRLSFKSRNRSVVWDLPTRTVLLDDLGSSCPALSPDGRHVVRLVKESNTVVWDLDEKRELARLKPTVLPHLAGFSPEGDRVALVCGPGVEVWNWKTGQRLAQFPLPTGSVALAWRPDGGALAVGCDDHTLYVWRPSETQLQRIACRGTGVRPFYHPAGELLATVSHHDKLRLWDAESGTQWLESTIGNPLGFSSDGQWLAVRRSRSVGRLRVHPPDVCRRLSAGPGLDRDFCGFAFSPNGRFLAAGLRGQVVIWDAPTRRVLWRQPTTGCPSILFPNPGLMLTTSAEGILAWTNLGSATAWSLSPPLRVVQSSGPIGPFAISPNQRQLAVTIPGSATVYDLPPITPLEFASASAPGADRVPPARFPLREPRFKLVGQPMIADARFSPDGRWIASGYWNNRSAFGSALCFWSAIDGRLAHRIPSARCAPYFSPDGRWFLAAAGRDYTLYACDGPPERWREVWRTDCDGLAIAVALAAFRHDATHVAVQANEQTIRLLETATGREAARLTPPGFLILGLTWSPDGRWLVVPMRTGTVVWDLSLLRTRLGALGLDWD
jgi:serine/threonine protein kinase/WD40 repeat protein